MSKHIIIAGGGLAGMSAATFLAEAGYRVTICESRRELGGKAKSGRTAEGNPTEHSLRVFSITYRTMLSLLARIPDGDGRFVLDNLVIVYLLRSLAGRLVGPKLPPQPVPRHTGRGEPKVKGGRLRRLVRNSLFVLLGFSRCGVPFRECLFYVYAHLRLYFRSNARLDEDLSAISYGDYLRMPTMSEAYRHYFSQLPLIIAAARPDADAFSITRMMSNIVFCTANRWRGFHHLPVDTVMMMNGPTSERMIEPWGRYLKKLGVAIETGATASDFEFSGGQVRTVILSDGRRLDCDGAVLALPYLALRRLAETTSLGGYAPHLKEAHKMRLESSSGIQLFLKELPDPLPAPFRPGVPTAHLESPWAFVSVVQGEGFWQGVSMARGARYVLSATWSTFERPGKVTGKPAWACSPEEMYEETVAQCGFDRRLVAGWQIGCELKHMADGEYQRSKDSMPPHLAYEPVDGVRVVNLAPLLIHLPGAPAASPRIQTEIANLCVAGEATWASELTIRVPTMEKAASSGFLAARQIVAHFDPNAARAMTLPPVEQLPFATLRKIDDLFWKRRHAKGAPEKVPSAMSVSDDNAI